MLQYLQDKKELYDFNHLMVDGKDATKYVYIAGHSTNGGMMGRIALDSNGLLNTEVNGHRRDYYIKPSHHRRLGTYRFGKI